MEQKSGYKKWIAAAGLSVFLLCGAGYFLYDMYSTYSVIIKNPALVLPTEETPSLPDMFANMPEEIHLIIPDDIKKLPNIPGRGRLYDLHTAVMADGSGKLKALLEQYISEKDIKKREKLVNPIIFHWTGVQDIDPMSRKPSFIKENPIQDARYLEAIERFLGERYSNPHWKGREEHNPHPQAAKHLLEAYRLLADFVRLRLEEQTHMKLMLGTIRITWNKDAQEWIFDISKAEKNWKKLIRENPAYFQESLCVWQKIVQEKFQKKVIEEVQKAAVKLPEMQAYLRKSGRSPQAFCPETEK